MEASFHDSQAFRYEVFSVDLKSSLGKVFRGMKGLVGETGTGHYARSTAPIQQYLSRFSERRNKSFLKNNYDTIPDVISIAVGFRIFDDAGGAHEGTPLYGRYPGSDLSYEALCELLMYSGYDPLFKLRKREYHSKIESEVCAFVERAIKNSKIVTVYNILKSAERVAKRIKEEVENTILGSELPNLSDRTMDIRERNQEEMPQLYPAGIEQPLVGTGQLLGSLTYDVQLVQTAWMEDFARKYVNRIEGLKRESRSAKRKAKQREQEAKRRRKISKKVRLERDDLIDRYFDRAERANRIESDILERGTTNVFHSGIFKSAGPMRKRLPYPTLVNGRISGDWSRIINTILARASTLPSIRKHIRDNVGNVSEFDYLMRNVIFGLEHVQRRMDKDDSRQIDLLIRAYREYTAGHGRAEQ